MKRVLVSNEAVKLIGNLRSSTGGYEVVKCQIADSLSNLAKMLNYGIGGTDEELHHYVNDIVVAMGVVADYNELVESLSDRRDVNLPHYVLEGPAEEEDERRYDYAPNENELELIKEVLEAEKIILPGVLELNEMTFSEIAATVGMSNEDLDAKVHRKRFGGYLGTERVGTAHGA